MGNYSIIPRNATLLIAFIAVVLAFLVMSLFSTRYFLAMWVLTIIIVTILSFVRDQRSAPWIFGLGLLIPVGLTLVIVCFWYLQEKTVFSLPSGAFGGVYYRTIIASVPLIIGGLFGVIVKLVHLTISSLL